MDTTVNITNGSRIIIGNGTVWMTTVHPGDAFKIDNDVVIYEVESITSDIELSLSVPYQGTTAINIGYSIQTGWTSNRGYAYPVRNDKDWMEHMRTGFIDKLDADMARPSSVTNKSGINMPLTVEECRGHIILVDSDGKVRIPPVSDFSHDAGFGVYVNGAYTVKLDPDNADRIKHHATTLADNHSLQSSGTEGDVVFLHKDSIHGWTTLFSYGTWIDGGTATTSSSTTSSSSSTTSSSSSTTSSSSSTTSSSSSTTSSSSSTTTTHPPTSWNEQQPAGDTNKQWSDMALSSDGSIRLAIVLGGRAYMYSSGTWAETQPAGATNQNWVSCAMSSDGSIMLITTTSKRMYMYSGGAWAETRPAGDADQNWDDCDVSGDGLVMMACINGRRLYRYSGGSWAETRPAGDTNKTWYGCALSDDGSVMFAVAHGNRSYLYKDGSWAETRPAGDTNQEWRHCAVSGDGNVLLATSETDIYLSTDCGANWNVVVPAIATGIWLGCMADYDGQTLAVCDNGGRLWISRNRGSSWVEERPAGDANKEWHRCALDSDGSVTLTGAFNPERLYLGTY